MMTVIFFLLQLALAIGTYLFSGYENDKVLLISGLLAVVLFPIIAIFEARRERWILSPLVCLMAMSTLYIGTATIWCYYTIILGFVEIHDMGLFNVVFDLPRAQAVGLFGTAFFYLGYKITGIGRLERSINSLKQKIPDVPVSFNGWLAIIGAAWLLRLLRKSGTNLGQFGNFSNHFTTFILVGAAAVMISSNEYHGDDGLRIKPAGIRMYVAIAVAVMSLFYSALQSGMRNPMLYLMIFCSWGYVLQREMYFRNQPLMKKIMSLIKPTLLVLVFAIIALTIVLPYGKQLAAGKSLPNRNQLKENTFDWAETFPRGGIWAFPARTACGLQGIAACIELRDFMPVENTVLDVVSFGIIPRIIWPEKPVVSRGGSFHNVLDVTVSASQESDIASSATAITTMGELYWSYGLSGMIIGMLLIGLAWGLTYEVFSYNFPRHPIRFMVACLMLMNSLMWFEGDASSNILMITIVWVVYFPLLWIGLFWVRTNKIPHKIRRIGFRNVGRY